MLSPMGSVGNPAMEQDRATMKTLLYAFAMLWFVTGMALLALAALGLSSGWLAWPMASIAEAGSDAGLPADLRLLVIAGFWLWTFLLPALLAGALGALLGRFDRLHRVLAGDDQRPGRDEMQSPRGAAPRAESRPTAETPAGRAAKSKVEPYIGADRDELTPTLKQVQIPPRAR